MTIGSWNPEATASTQLNDKVLKTLLRFSQEESLQNLTKSLSPEEQQQYLPIICLPKAEWDQIENTLDNEQLIELIKFFTLAEKLPGWQAAEKSAVIHLAKIYRQRGDNLPKELLLWIRQNTDNRFLPYGSL